MTSLRRMWRTSDPGERAFTLVEVLIAAAVVAVALVPLFGLFVHGTRWTADSRHLITAVNLAQNKLEELKNARFEDISTRPDPGAPPLQFQEDSTYSYRVDVASTGPNLKTVTVTVYYETASGPRTVSLTMDRGRWRE